MCSEEWVIRLQQAQTWRGCPSEPGKSRITIRLDDEILDHFRERVHQMGGGSYQIPINDALREHIRRSGIEAAVRRAVREELRGPALSINGRIADDRAGRMLGFKNPVYAMRL